MSLTKANAVDGLDETHADFQRELAAVLAAPDQVEELPHRSDLGLREEFRLMLMMNLVESIGYENVVPIADKLLLFITKHVCGEGVNEQNRSARVDDDNPFRQRLQEGPYG